MLGVLVVTVSLAVILFAMHEIVFACFTSGTFAFCAVRIHVVVKSCSARVENAVVEPQLTLDAVRSPVGGPGMRLVGCDLWLKCKVVPSST